MGSSDPAASSQWHPLVAGKDAFERGKVDNFVTHSHDLGSLTAIEISHNGHGHNPSWFCQQVVVTDQLSGVKSTFPVRAWLEDEINGCSRVCKLQDGRNSELATYTVRVMVLPALCLNVFKKCLHLGQPFSCIASMVLLHSAHVDPAVQFRGAMKVVLTLHAGSKQFSWVHACRRVM